MVYLIRAVLQPFICCRYICNRKYSPFYHATLC